MRVLVHRKCSKSNAALDALIARGYEPLVLEYMEEGVLTRALLEELEARLAQPLRALLRTKEGAYAAAETLSDEALYAYVAEHPILLERPIVLARGAALVARPPREVWELVPEVYLASTEVEVYPEELEFVREQGDETGGGWLVITADNIPIGARRGDQLRVAPGWEELGIERLLGALGA